MAAEALKAPRKISRAAKIMGGIALSTVGVTAAAAAGPHHSSSQRSSPVLPGAGHAAKQNSPAEYKVSTDPQCQIVVVFDEPPVRPDILQLLAELQLTTRNQQSSAEFPGWGTRTLTITVKLTAATALIKAVEHFIVEILKIRGTREITGKVGDEEIRIKGTNDIAQLREALEQLQAHHVTLHAWNEGNCRYFRAAL